jgi:hypothetical protein
MSCPILPCARTLLALSMSLNVVQRTRGTASHKRVSVHVLVIAKNSNLFIAILEGILGSAVSQAKRYVEAFPSGKLRVHYTKAVRSSND